MAGGAAAVLDPERDAYPHRGCDADGAPVCPVVRYVNDRDAEDLLLGEVEPLIPAQIAFNTVNFDRLVVSRFGAFPQRYIIGWTGTRAEVARASMSRVWMFGDLPDEVKIGDLQAASVAGYNELLDTMRQDIAIDARVPLTSISGGTIANLSADALAMYDKPHQTSLTEKRESFGESHEQLLGLGARQTKLTVDEAAEVVWRDTEAARSRRSWTGSRSSPPGRPPARGCRSRSCSTRCPASPSRRSTRSGSRCAAAAPPPRSPRWPPPRRPPPPPDHRSRRRCRRNRGWCRVPSRAEVAAFRRTTGHVATVVAADLGRFWDGVDTSSAATARAALDRYVPTLVATYGQAAALVAADFYDTLRDQAKAPGRYTAVMADPAPAEQVQGAIGWAVSPLEGEEPDPGQALANLVSSCERLTIAPGRETVSLNAARDPAAPRWARVPESDNPCAFCWSLAARGPVYASEESAGGMDEYHDHCQCAATPIFDGQELPDGYDPDALLSSYETAKDDATGSGLSSTLAQLRQQEGVK